MYDITKPEVANALIQEVESSESRERRQLEYRAYKVSEGAQIEYVKAELKRLFPKSYKSMRVADISLSKKVLDKLCSYKQQPIRVCGEKTEELNAIYEEADFYSSLVEYDRDFNRQRYALLWVNKIGDQYKLMPLKGFESFIVLNKNTGALEVVILNYPATDITSSGFGISDGINQQILNSQDDAGEKKIYVLWTKEHHVAYFYNGKSATCLVDPENPNGVNPVGRMPFVYRSRVDCSLPFINPITDQSITTNVLLSDLLTSSSLQGFGQLILRLPKEVDITTVHSGQSTAIKLPLLEGREQQPEASYINANPDLAGMQKVVYDYVSSILSEHGLSNETVNGETSTFNSGLERLISQADAQNIVNQNQRVMAGVEKEIFEIIKLYDPTFASESLTVIFEKAKVLISDAETLANIEKRISLGLISKVEALKMLDPNLSDEQAKEKLDKIKEELDGSIRGFLQSEARPVESTEQEPS